MTELVTEPDLYGFEPLSDQMLADPYAVYARLRRHDPVHWHEGLRGWLVASHSGCTTVLDSPQTYINDFRRVGEPERVEELGVQTLDGVEHAEARQAILAALRKLDVRTWAQKCVSDVLEGHRWQADEPFNFVSDVVDPVTQRSIVELFGIPWVEDDTTTYQAALRALVLGMDAGLQPARRTPKLKARAYVTDLLEPWITSPPKDSPVLREIHRALSMASGQAEANAIRNSVRMTFFAGIMSPGSTLACIWRTLLEARLLDADEPLVLDRTSYAELVRHSGGVQVDARACVHDISLDGHLIRRGQDVLILTASANRDETVFDGAEELNLSRSNNPHLGFGRGAHSCVGARVAQTLHINLVNSISSRFRFRMAGTPVPRPSGTLRGFDHLPTIARPR